ncbi:MAG: hypothetical protein AB7O97_02620 [Planctomycetota bacterium]
MRTTLILFAAGLLLRLVPWLLSPEQALPATAAYRGDAEYWLQSADPASGLLAQLPFRPPAMTWLAHLLAPTDGDATLLRLVFVVLGALVAPLMWLLLRRSFAASVAALAAWICALSGALITVGSGLHGELPYLLLFLLSMFDFDRLRAAPAPAAAVRWGLLGALACLVRADHLLFVALALPWLWRARRGSRRRDLLLALGTLALALLPWQLHAKARVTAWNRGELGTPAPELPPPGAPALPWDAAALARVRAMPAPCRLWSFAFVDATARHRGHARVAEADVQLLDEAFGCVPEPLRAPVIAVYGPLNFFLANSPEALANGGFTRAPLDRPPPMLAERDRYPPWIDTVVPTSGQLTLLYPPHLHALNHGHRLGLAWLWQHPGDALRLAGAKLAQTWRGAATGLGALQLPMGRDGLREPVDLVVADGAVATVWRALLLLAAVAGAARLGRQPAAAGWALWLVCRVAIAVAFFGYARLGALCVPALALCWAALLAPLLETGIARRAAWLRWLGAAAITALLLVDAARAPRTPTVTGPGRGAEDARATVAY